MSSRNSPAITAGPRGHIVRLEFRGEESTFLPVAIMVANIVAWTDFV
jgi:hypothetical protein